MADTAALNRLLEPEIESLGYRLVRVALIGGKSDPTLQIMAEKPSTRQLDLSDCEVISRRLSETLDRLEAEGSDPIEGSYRLEVSSPGIDRPLTRLADFEDWKGHEARIALAEPLNGRKQFAGEISGAEGDTVRLTGKDGVDYAIPFASIHSAKLLLTDKLIASTAPLSTEGADTIQTVED
ncbi:ribosome maturation protein RimP [Sphingomonas sp. SM33]|uniref:Ribosome maturation factor RimP n=1 Tax=Sphingomonas telluris TaxID=2907998 RepID=A0ABS9VHZ6_9SPHN|nr:ribosome maturation protein RimP [Sphingomonas telluris]